MARRCQGCEPGRRERVAGLESGGSSERRAGSRIKAGVARLPCALLVGETEQDEGLHVAPARRDPVLKLGDVRCCVAGGESPQQALGGGFGRSDSSVPARMRARERAIEEHGERGRQNGRSAREKFCVHCFPLQ
jgi:hypothetical protein